MLWSVAERLTAALRAVVAAAVIVFYAYMAVVVLIQVLGRYVFNYSIDWATETATFAQIWMVLLAALLTMQPTGTANAYLDPGSGSFIIQILIAALAGGLLTLRVFWGRITDVFKKSDPSGNEATGSRSPDDNQAN